MDTLALGQWRRRRPEDLQVPGDAVSPPGPGPCEGEGGIAGRTPSGSGDSWRQKREEAGRRPGAGGRRAPAWAERSGRGLSGANRPSGRACAEMRARGGGRRARPLGRSTVGGAWRGGPPLRPRPRKDADPGGIVRPRGRSTVGGACVGRVAPQTAPAQRCRPVHLGVLETQGWLHVLMAAAEASEVLCPKSRALSPSARSCS